MVKSKRLFCQVHEKWYDPSKGMCPLCEKEEYNGEDFFNDNISSGEADLIDTEFVFMSPETFEGQILDPDSIKIYREQILRSAEEAYNRIKWFRIVNIISMIIFIAIIFLLFTL